MWKEKEFLDLLESKGIDTVCFMGSGYDIEDVHVGAEFFFSYAFLGRKAKEERPNALRDVLIKYEHLDVTDKYKIIKKFKFKPNIIYGGKYRLEEIMVKNLTTKKEHKLSDEEVDNLFRCIFDTI